jgi:MFS family permease
MRDRRILFITAFVRAMTTSFVGVSMGVYLARLGLGGGALGTIVSAGLLGATIAALLATLLADRVGRRRTLVALAVLSAIGTLVFAFNGHMTVLLAAAFVAMLNGMGRDRGAALSIEQAALTGTTGATKRTMSIAWYTMLQDAGHAMGALAAGLPGLIEQWTGLRGTLPQRTLLVGCALGALCAAGLYTRLSSAVEQGTAPRVVRLSARGRAVLIKISALFALDSLAGGFLTTALLSYFFFERFGAPESLIALLFFGARVMNAGSHLGAAWLARRIGLVNTMVFTHMPSSVLLATVAIAPTFAIAAVLFLLREGLVEMDVPTRQSYVLAVVEPEERTFASGVTNLVRLAAWAIAPALAGTMMIRGSIYAPLLIGASMKIAYDVLLWVAFRRIKPPEETA